ncbi:MAG: phage shock protein PspA [Gammaproteobacteria bacterium]|jgi:phage shock protein A|nr:phage shock protein PspA [Gammaproteobacteria bacterium]MBT5204366.1 phage shock protein PspA [Gammaproteobacteria bacterium]MBT5602273.1 phage shock protein PspA [Gammaproteobacteria bacterium]
MGIFSRFTDIINANINAILDKAEDPEKMVRLIIQEMEETLVEVRTQSAKLIADKKELERKSARWGSEIDEWERKAEVAISKQREDLARAALKEKRNCEEASMMLQGELQQVSDSLEKLSGDVGQLQQKLKDAKQRQKALILRGDTAKSRMGVKRQLHTVNIDEALTKFDRFERRIDDLEGEVEAFELGQKSLSDEIEELERDEQVTADLAELKAKMGQLDETQAKD